MLKHTRYTSGGQYTLNGQTYVGAYHVEDGIAYTGSSVMSTRKQLTPLRMLSVLADMSEYDFTRSPRIKSTLPNTKDKVCFEIGAHITGEDVERKMNLLLDNLAYIYTRTRIPRKNDQTTSKVSSRAPTLYPTVDSQVIDCEYSDNKVYVYVSDHLNGTRTVHAEIVDSNGDKIAGKDVVLPAIQGSVSSIAYSSYKLYIATEQSVIVCDMQYVIQEDVINTLQTFVIAKIGGDGDIYSTTGFKQIKKITADQDFVYVYDSAAKCTKIFTHMLSWVFTSRIGTLPIYQTKTVADVKANPFTSNIYMLFTDGTLVVYTKDGGLVQQTNLKKAILNESAVFTSIDFAHVNQNVVFISTTNNVYQLDSNNFNLLSTFASFDGSITDISDEQFVNNMAMPVSGRFENVCAISTETIVDGLPVYDTQFYKVIFNPWDLKITEPVSWLNEDIKHPMMPFSFLTFNILLAQVVECVDKLRKTLAYVPVVSGVGVQNNPAYTGIEHIRVPGQQLLDIDLNKILFIGCNEQMLADVLNRSIAEIIDFQEIMLQVIADASHMGTEEDISTMVVLNLDNLI